MLLPRFTLRTGLVLLTVGAVVSVAFREAWRGEPWAIGIAVAVGSLGLSFAVQAVAFFASLGLSSPAADDAPDGPPAAGAP